MEEISIIEKTRHWQRMLAAEMASIEVKLKAYKDTPTPESLTVHGASRSQPSSVSARWSLRA